MLNENDWAIAKELTFNYEIYSRTGQAPNIIDSIFNLLSCQTIFLYSLQSRANESAQLEAFKGRKLTKYSDAKTFSEPVEPVAREFANNILMRSKNTVSWALKESKSRGFSAKCLSVDEQKFSYIIIIQRNPLPPLQIVLHFHPDDHPCQQKLLLVESFITPIACRLLACYLPDRSTHPLSKRQLQILTQISSGKTASQVAWNLGITERTVNFHLGTIYRKLGARSRQEALHVAQQAGIMALSMEAQ